MIRVGITGQPGFVGTHLFEALGKQPEKYQRIPFEDVFFDEESKLRAFIRQCDVIVHLAAMMRNPIEGEVYKVNMRLVHQLIGSMEAENVHPSVLFSSSIQEGNGSEYGRSKQEGRKVLSEWARKHNTGYGGMIFPNLFGPGARPNSHSFIATFCYKLTHGEEPKVIVDNTVSLKYIDNVINMVLPIIDEVSSKHTITDIVFDPDYQLKVTEVLNTLNYFKECEMGCVSPSLNNQAEKDLFETFESYKNYNL